MPYLNISATLNLLRSIKNPSLICPHYTISTFDQLSIPLSSAFRTPDGQEPDIRAVVLDKDNCFAVPHELTVYKEYESTFTRLRAAYPGDRLLIVSNSSGTWEDRDYREAAHLERTLGIKVLRHHSTKKPGCWPEVFEHLKKSDAGVTRPDQVAVVGDRLFTDVVMANMMGSWAVWVKEGVRPASGNLMGRGEHWVAQRLFERGWRAPTPSSRLL
ncbi:HAD-superfamily phosphatase [Ascodesmis nigricans]|uniref:HAD-superfamily phosphatase n=1 Tax=Ascodesmis nigricans TaxID=341454 RepID=A0A4S2N2G7_9PEZI|nr:HAD-superfamily phosphatase [Ascodesmis nigricans]